MRNRLRNRRGAVAVEFAITAPVLLLLLFGSYELSRANMMMHTCEAAAYEGARTGIVPGATAQEVEDSVEEMLAAIGIKNASISTRPNNLSRETDTVAVTVSVRFSDNSVFAPAFVGNKRFERTCEMTRETF